MQRERGKASDHAPRPSIISVGSDSDVKGKEPEHARRRRRTTRKSSLDEIEEDPPEDPNDQVPPQFHRVSPLSSPLRPLPDHKGVFAFSPASAGEEAMDDGMTLGSEERGRGVKRRRGARTSRGGLTSPFSMSQIDDCAEEEDSMIPSPVAKKTKRGKKTEEEKLAEANEKARLKEEKKRAKDQEREDKKAAAEVAKIEKKAMSLTQKALRGTDGETRIRIKASTKAAGCNWYSAALTSINTLLSLPSPTTASSGVVTVSPTLPLGSEFSIISWTRLMPLAAAQALVLRGGSGGAAKEGSSKGAGDAMTEVAVMVPMILLVLPPEDLVAEIQRDKLNGIMDRMGKVYPDCSLFIASCGLDNFLAKKQARTPGFNLKQVEDFILDIVISPSSSALHLRLDLKDEAHLVKFPF